jgi:hypothetical protein
MLNADFMVAAMLTRALRVKAAAEAIAPFDPGSTDGTHYRDSFTAEAHPKGGVHHDRAAGVVSNDDGAAFFIEWGNRNITRHRVLGRALDAAGGES